MPESYLLGDRAVYIDAFLAAKGALSADGIFPDKGAETAFRALASIDAEIAAAKLDLGAVFTNAELIRHIQQLARKHPGLLLLTDPVAHRMMMDEGKDRITGNDAKANLDFLQGRAVREDAVLYAFGAYAEHENGDGASALHNEVARLLQLVVAEKFVSALADPAFIAKLDVAHAGYRPRVARLHEFAREWLRLEALPHSERHSATDKIWRVTIRTAIQ